MSAAGVITEAQLDREALKGRYYVYAQQSWQSMGWVEWLARTVFSLFCLMEPVHEVCLRHSWKSIERCATLPPDIAHRIDDLFFDSLMPTNPRSTYSASLGRIFCKAHRNTQTQIDIEPHPTARSFEVFQNQQLLYRVSNSGYGQLDFYTSDRRRLFNNNHDSLWDESGRRIGAIKLAVDYKSLNGAMEISDGRDKPLMHVAQNKSKELLIFREAMTHQLLAVASLLSRGCWSVTLLAPDLDDKRHLLVLGALKYSQHYHFPNPDEVPYTQV